jgi:hypothetical protein
MPTALASRLDDPRGRPFLDGFVRVIESAAEIKAL